MTDLLKSVRVMKNWEERTVWEDGSGKKMTNATVTYSSTGDMAGESVVNYSLVYATPSRAIFIGFEQISGSLGSETGTLVLRHEGVFENGTATIAVQVLSEVGAGIFAGRSGTGQIESDPVDPAKGRLALSLHA